MAGQRYRKQRKDLNALDPASQEYWEEILRREGLSMSRGQYPQRISYGWNYQDTDGRNESSRRKLPEPLSSADTPSEHGPESGPQSKPIGDSYGTVEDSYSEDSRP